ncbi:restriction endonuclease subunit S [Azonexus hydrophilus]|uniref:Restriction endonuclease subunit S n=1 Tax=Azonexus hydrophilus TaxID=418702 RepID=A0ABZ2XKM9_9RHOO
MGEFPASWVLLPVSEAVRNVTLTDKKIPQKNYLPNGKFPVFDQGQDYVGGYTDDAAMVVDCELPAIVFGDHTRVVKLVNTAFAPGADGVKVLQPSSCILPKLLEHFVRYLVTKIPNNGYARHYQHLAKSLLPIPPLPEQHRIVAKIEELFSELDQGVASLKTAREQLKVYRQSLLKNAFEGKLTAAWRAAHADQLETAAALQQRIARERQVRYQQQLADWQTAGQAGPKPKPPKPLPPLTPEELAELPELPEGWEWIKSGYLFEFVTSGSRGWAPYYSDSGALFLRITNLDFDSLALDLAPEKIQFVRPPLGAEGLRTKVQEGDFLFSITGYLGMFAIAPRLAEAYVNQHIALVRPTKGYSPKYFGYYVTSQSGGLHHLGKQTKGAVKAGLGLDDIQGFPVPLCSLTEQEQIVRVLESKLSEADQLDQTLATALQQADALRQSILKKAFCGQLVKQDKNDEPATALLERIRAARGTEKPARRGHSASSQR